MSQIRSQRPVWLGEDNRGWDHVRVHVQLLRDERIGAYELAVYTGLVAHAELKTGEAHPSASLLGRYGLMSERKVRECIGLLRSIGYIAVEHHAGEASVYRLLPPPPLPEEARQEVPGSSEQARQVVPGSPAGGAGPPLHVVPDTPAGGADKQEPENKTHETRDKKPSNRAVADDDPVFAAFWSAYPNKRDKGAARSVWKRAIGKVKDPDVIVAAAAAYRDDPNRDDRFTKHPATWLNHECWNDPPLTPRAGSTPPTQGSTGRSVVMDRLRNRAQ